MIDPHGLLMMEPTKLRSEHPVEDRASALALLAWERARIGPAYRGVHTCICGVTSDNVAWTVDGLRTNSLLVHYVRWHREEVGPEDLVKLEKIGIRAMEGLA